MIPYKGLIGHFQTMLDNKWGYIAATAGTLWTQAKQDAAKTDIIKRYGQKWVGHRVADCSGAFVYTYKQYGLSIYHGSNRIAREYVIELLPPEKAQPGMAAFKSYKQGDKNYRLPGEYKQGGAHYNGDLNDYYHIGVVDLDPKYVINAATTQSGVIRSKLANGWSAVGYLKAVNYEEEHMADVLYVTAPNGGTVNMRKSASVTSDIVAKVPVGEAVNVIGVASNGWTNISWRTKKGWMMSKFLTEAQNPAQDEPDDSGQENNQEEIEALEEALKSIKTQANLISNEADRALERLIEIKVKEG